MGCGWLVLWRDEVAVEAERHDKGTNFVFGISVYCKRLQKTRRNVFIISVINIFRRCVARCSQV